MQRATDAITLDEQARTLVEKNPDRPLSLDDETGAQQVWRMLLGFYGNVLLARYTSGDVIPKGKQNAGQDAGVVNARRIWAHRLRDFDNDTIGAAVRDTEVRYPEYPPTLPQFLALCRARAPRKVLGDKDAVVKLGMSQELRSSYARRMREAIARSEERARQRRKEVVQVEPGLEGLIQMVGMAVGAAGGDEVATITRLTRDLAPRGQEVARA